MSETEKEFKERVNRITNAELIEMADNIVSKLCKTGGESFKMTVPPMADDSDIVLSELIRRYKAATIQEKLVSFSWDVSVERPKGKKHLFELYFTGNGPSDYIALHMPFEKANELRGKLRQSLGEHIQGLNEDLQQTM